MHDRGSGGDDLPDPVNDTEAGTEARETDASVTTDEPASAEPFENPNGIVACSRNC